MRQYAKAVGDTPRALRGRGARIDKNASCSRVAELRAGWGHESCLSAGISVELAPVQQQKLSFKLLFRGEF
jgi:hypothetical protein